MERSMSLLFALVTFGLACGVGCSTSSEPDDPNDPGDPGSVQLAVEVVAGGLSSPVYLTAPAGDPRLFVVEQAGRIRIVKDRQLLGTPFLDISSKVASGGERGLLSIAFHPDYASNGFFYTSYTDNNGDTRIERYTVTADPDVADPNSAKLILAEPQPAGNHNGGLILFGPDGMLYIGLGDGGGGGDTYGNGQNLGTRLGALLRVDVDAGDPFVIPTDNPFVNDPNARGEIWAYGLRNPWRFAFDGADGVLYIADVGQNDWEEVNAVSATAGGLNYGWPIMEAAHCFSPRTGCNQTGLVMPVIEYDHGDGCSVTGGFVYRGTAIPELRGHYFYSDWCSGFLRSFRYSNGSATDQRDWAVGSVGRVLSFGVDAAGELYILSGNGRVYRLKKTG